MWRSDNNRVWTDLDRYRTKGKTVNIAPHRCLEKTKNYKLTQRWQNNRAWLRHGTASLTDGVHSASFLTQDTKQNKHAIGANLPAIRLLQQSHFCFHTFLSLYWCREILILSLYYCREMVTRNCILSSIMCVYMNNYLLSSSKGVYLKRLCD